MAVDSDRWQFWIDVGGTFTDCLFQSPDGKTGQVKVLSSSTVKGKLTSLEDATSFRDSMRIGYPNHFWSGYPIRFLNATGNTAGESIVNQFDSITGTFRFEPISIRSDLLNYELLSPETSPLLAIRSIMGLGINEQIPDCDIALGTTRGTNALLTRSGAITAFVTTAGFGDLLEIGDQTRPKLFDINIQKRKPLCMCSIEIDERILHDGSIEKPIDAAKVESQLRKLKLQGVTSLAICLMHGYRNPGHEQIVKGIATNLEFENISCSSDVAPLIKLLPRSETTLLDAYLNPLLVKYLADIKNTLTPNSQLQLMTSAGSLVPPDRFSGKESTLSGPAGGIVGMARSAEAVGIKHVIGFDMGGTSTDVSRYDGQFNYDYESEKAGVRIFSPVLAIETVASGGGSICKFDGSRLLVGPESAGAEPGPACYGRSGPLTITDVNLFLGRINETHFPFRLDRSVVEAILIQMCQEINSNLSINYSPLGLANAFFVIANNQMASAVKTVSVSKGFDARNYSLNGFGGAAGQHLCAVAQQLGIKRALVHPQASLLSAYGMQFAERSSSAVRSILKPIDELNEGEISTIKDQLVDKATEQLEREGCQRHQVKSICQLELRFAGTESYLPVDILDENVNENSIVKQFEQVHLRQFGYLLENPVEVGAMHIMASEHKDKCDATAFSSPNVGAIQETEAALYFDNDLRTVPVHDRTTMKAGAFVLGPAQIVDQFTTLIVDAGWKATIASDLQIILEQTSEQPVHDNEQSEGLDPMLLEVFNNHFGSIADQMGRTLQKTSSSVNVKERLDFSCAVFNSHGDLIVNAQHIPVHLGSMSHTVKALLRLNDSINIGDVFVTNDPFNGGSHLPDVTVVTPVFLEDQSEKPMFFVASRSHHAEIGGIAPGSMPPAATCLDEEGVLIANFKLFESGVPRFNELKILLESGKYPSRSPELNIADIKAQVASNRRGTIDLLKLVDDFGATTVLRYMSFMMDASSAKVLEAIKAIGESPVRFHDYLDNGLKICVSISRNQAQLVIDFSGTSPTSKDNHNANRAIVSAAVMYCLRCMVDQDIPLNEGLLRPVKISLPDCFLNPTVSESMSPKPAVAAGNVETSQRIVDVVLAALGLAAASQGTMNNLLIGNESFGYYETICGGAGATRRFSGASAVHTHMTNTRLTDPEIVESTFPMIVRHFGVRHGSGGLGKFSGGDGIRRELEFLEPLTVSFLTNRRAEYPPFGLEGGCPGAVGSNWLLEQNAQAEKGYKAKKLEGRCTIQVNAGDRIVIETPGGGGFGVPDSDQQSSCSEFSAANSNLRGYSMVGLNT